VIYLDASALVTIVVKRPHAGALRRFLDTHATVPTCTSTIGFVETVRTCYRIGNFPNLINRLRYDHSEIELSRQVGDAAVNVPEPLRTLDAIHVASAETLGADLIALITYDKKMAEAARRMGLPVAMPGAE
jgi:uncharacterized protein